MRLTRLSHENGVAEAKDEVLSGRSATQELSHRQSHNVPVWITKLSDYSCEVTLSGFGRLVGRYMSKSELFSRKSLRCIRVSIRQVKTEILEHFMLVAAHNKMRQG